MWTISRLELLRFLTSKPYSSLSFDIYCRPGKSDGKPGDFGGWANHLIVIKFN